MFYAENIKGENFQDGIAKQRVPYFYVHGRLEDEAGYDCCTASVEELSYVTMLGAYLTNLKTLEGEEVRVLVCTYLSLGRINGLIVAVDDTESNIKYCIDYLKQDSLYSHHIKEIDEKYPIIKKLLKTKK
jgi:hypothetical protein